MKYLLPLVLLTGCAGWLTAPANPACSYGQLAELEANYVADVLAACEGQDYDECTARPEIAAKYDALRERWIECR